MSEKRKYKCVIIDDQDYAIAALKADLIENFENLEICGEANGVLAGVKTISKTNPDIIFLDIEMGDGDGFDVLDILNDVRHKIIFITGSKEYAIKAFKYAAVDYILKPVDIEELKAAIEKIIGNKNEEIQNSEHSTKLSLNTNEEIKLVDVSDIIRLESDGNYTKFYFKDKSNLLITKTLKEYDQALAAHDFLRVHQSHLVNFNQIEAYKKTEGGYLLMKDGSIVPVSVRKKAEIMEILNSVNS
jgi:two-component system LytT family response regulator